MKELESSGRTVDEAVELALVELGVPRDRIVVEVIRKGSRGIFGMGSEEARVRVRLRPETEPATGQPATETTDRVAGPQAGTRATTAEAGTGEVAPEVLGEVLRLMGVSASVEVNRPEPDAPLSLNIVGENLGALIGRRGQTLACLQYIVRLIVSERVGKFVPILIDVSGYKQHRREALQRLALNLAEQVTTSRRPVTMEPMPSDERRVVHLALADHAEVTTQSVGEGEERKVVIQLKKR